MIGFSVYLSQPLANLPAQLETMKQAGFTSVFTSLHLPEDEPKQVKARLQQLTRACQKLHLQVIADVSAKGLQRLQVDITDLQAVKGLQVTGLRIDAGVSMPVAAELSRHMPIALNASTISAADIEALKANQADFSNLEAWHNFYPREDTGLSRQWYLQKNHWLHQRGLKTMGFIAGDGRLRGPVHAGLPTLEAHRGLLPLAAYLDLKQLETDRVYVGDPGLSKLSLALFQSYNKDHVILLAGSFKAPQLQRIWHNRPDVAANVIRLAEARQDLVLGRPQPAAPLERSAGSITVDNTNYARYAGEVQITKVDLPKDARVNVLGCIIPEELPLLNDIGASQAVKLWPADALR